MHQATYSKHFGRAIRRPGVMPREEWSVRARELSLRGEQLPHAKLCEADVIAIRSAAKLRDELRKHILENLTNEALAKKYGTSKSNIEMILSRERWSHVA